MAELIVLTAFLEIAFYKLPLLKKLRRYALPLISAALIAISMLALFGHFTFLYIVAVIAGGYRIINMLRVVKARSHERYISKAATDTALILGLFQGILFALDWIFINNGISVMRMIVLLQVVLAVVLISSLIRNIKKTSSSRDDFHASDHDLPTVTVAIPARNETRELEECLWSVLASDYPKLEIIVLDDCSHKETADIIKSFAHKGVRFVQGYPPSNDWLAKNLAYDRLADESSGEYILFCGVDVRFNSGAIRAMVNETLGRKKDMLSVLPYRIESSLASTVVQPIRYWWELALPRRLINRPPVLSTCWIIHRRALEKKGGFEAVRRSIIPERYFARELVKTDKYSFLRSSGKMDIKTEKKVSSSRATVERIRYPQLDKRPEFVYFLGLYELMLMLGPVVLLIPLLLNDVIYGSLALFAALIFACCNLLIVQTTNPRRTLLSTFSYPLTVMADIVLTNISMYKYEFSVVEWKGRNLCVPVMSVYTKLPDIGAKTRQLH